MRTILAILALLAGVSAAGASQAGLASVYWEDRVVSMRDRHGRQMPFDPHRLAAASRDLPLGSCAWVSRPGRALRRVLVLINDRGPCYGEPPSALCRALGVSRIRKRIVDLTPAAADYLGMGRGLAPVRVEPELCAERWPQP